jgi:hypothetical protein
MPPRPVVPVIANGIEYSADGDGRDAFLVATDLRDSKEIWRTKVFHNHIKFWIEEDVQWVYITNLKMTGETIFVRDEKARCYAVGIKTKRARKHACDNEFSSVTTVN